MIETGLEAVQVAGATTIILIGGKEPAGFHCFHEGDPVILSAESQLVLDFDPVKDAPIFLVNFLAQGEEPEETKALPLFPGTLEISGQKKRLRCTLLDPSNFSSMRLEMGVNESGDSTWPTGAKKLSIGFADARPRVEITWMDNSTEVLF